MAWTEECIASMKTLFDDGLSAAQIAEKLNGTYRTFFSRNAVIGKLHRCGLRRAEGSVVIGRPKRTGPRRPYKKRWTPEATLVPIEPQETETAMTIPDNVIPPGQRKSLMELTEQTCKWPVGDPGTPEFFFCGAESVAGRPYCNYHCRVAYAPSTRAPERWHFRGMAA